MQKLSGLRGELAELAFVLDQQGSREAADVAMQAAARIEELCDEARLDGASAWGEPRSV